MIGSELLAGDLLQAAGDEIPIRCRRHVFPFAEVLFLERHFETADEPFDGIFMLPFAKGADGHVENEVIRIGFDHLDQNGDHSRVGQACQSKNNVVAVLTVCVGEHLGELHGFIFMIEAGQCQLGGKQPLGFLLAINPAAVTNDLTFVCNKVPSRRQALGRRQSLRDRR